MSFLKRVLTVASGGGLIASLLAFLPFWPGDMFAPFRVQYLIIGLVCGGCGLAQRSGWLVASCFFTVGLSAAPVAVRLAEREPLAAHGDGGRPVSIVAMNVLHFNTDYGRAAGLAVAEDSDVVAAFETTPEWLSQLAVLDRHYPYRYSPAGLKTAGISIHSKAPFTAELYRIGSRNAPLVKAEFTHYVVLAAHPYPPATPRLTDDLDLYIETLTRLAHRQSKPVIIAGDLNATLWSPSMSPLLRDRWQWPEGAGFAYSWPTFLPPLAIQIDHVLTKGAKAGRYRVLSPIGSDHLPVRADLRL